MSQTKSALCTPLPTRKELVLGSTAPWHQVLCVQRVKVTGAIRAHPVHELLQSLLGRVSGSNILHLTIIRYTQRITFNLVEAHM